MGILLNIVELSLNFNSYCYFCAMSRKRKKQVFSNLEVIDAGAKGKTVAKAPDGRIVFLPNAVPGDIVDVQTFKSVKVITKVRLWLSINYPINVPSLFANILGLVEAVNGRIWLTSISCSTNKTKSLII